MKKLLLSPFIILLILTAFAGKIYAQTVYNWTGAGTGGTNKFYWDNPGNWLVGGSVPATYPGQNGLSTDSVVVGVNYSYSNTNYPYIRTGYNIKIASLIIGDNTAVNSINQVYSYFYIAGTLNVAGTILQKHSNNIGFAGDGTPGYPINYDFVVHTYIWGPGAINAASFQIGDTTLPPANIANVTRVNLGSYGVCPTITISGDLILNSMSSTTTGTTINQVNNAELGINTGANITIGGQIKLINSATSGNDPYNFASGSQYQPHSWFSLQVFNNASGAPYNNILNLTGATPLYSSPASSYGKGSNIFDFYAIDRATLKAGTTSNLDKTTVNYSGTVDQKVYTIGSFPISSVIDTTGGTYNYLGFSGSGRKTVDATPGTAKLNVSGDINLAAGSEIVDLSVNNPTLTLNNASMIFTSYGTPNYTYTIPIVSNIITGAGSTFQNGSAALYVYGTTSNGGTFNTATGTVNLVGALSNSGNFNQTGTGVINVNNNYTNTGKFLQTAGTVNLNQSGNQTLTDNSAATVGTSATPAAFGTTFSNVNVQNGGTKTLTGSGQFYVNSNGKLNMIANTSLAANGLLTLKSDASGDAILPAVPSTCTISGNVTVQRYVSANRAYRLISSPVYTGNDGTNNIAGITYLKTNTYLTGSGGGFDKTGNPTLYLYRENLAPLYTTFLNSNYRGISDISGTPYGMNDASYPTANIPVGNGVLFYYRGSRKQASLTTLTTAGAAATTDTLNSVGTLNVGNVTVHDWYTPGSANLGYTTASGDPTVEGFNLVGNPYASSIDWDQYGSGIVQNQVANFSYKLIPSGLQGSGNYDVYTAGTPSKTGTQGTPNANIIASGEGFFVQALDPTVSSLTFTEAAKSNTVVTGASLYMAKSVVNVVPQFLRLQMALDSINTDGLIINFGDGYKTTFDPKEDARYKVGTGKVSLSSLSSDNIALAINQMPLSGKTVTVPLKISATANGTYSLNMKALSGIPTLYDVFLKDAYTKDSVNMRNVKNYSFTIALTDTSSFGKNRFSLVLTQDAALAYQLVNFNASKANNGSQVEVVWNTVNEANYTHFTVERSTDGGNTYETIGALTADSQGAYSILDKSPLNGANLYRLKQEDYNSVITYSKVVQIAFTPKADNLLKSALNVYPNPVSSNMTLTIDPKSAEAGSYHIQITNSTGLVVKQVKTTETSWSENLSNLFSGTYLVKVINDKDNTLIGQTKFVKL